MLQNNYSSSLMLYPKTCALARQCQHMSFFQGRNLTWSSPIQMTLKLHLKTRRATNRFKSRAQGRWNPAHYRRWNKHNDTYDTYDTQYEAHKSGGVRRSQPTHSLTFKFKWCFTKTLLLCCALHGCPSQDIHHWEFWRLE